MRRPTKQIKRERYKVSATFQWRNLCNWCGCAILPTCENIGPLLMTHFNYVIKHIRNPVHPILPSRYYTVAPGPQPLPDLPTSISVPASRHLSSRQWSHQRHRLHHHHHHPTPASAAGSATAARAPPVILSTSRERMPGPGPGPSFSVPAPAPTQVSPDTGSTPFISASVGAPPPGQTMQVTIAPDPSSVVSVPMPPIIADAGVDADADAVAFGRSRQAVSRGLQWGRSHHQVAC